MIQRLLRRPSTAIGALSAVWTILVVITLADAGADAAIERGLSNALATAAALLIVLRATTRRSDRIPWLLIGLGALGWAIGHASVMGRGNTLTELDAGSLVCGATLLAGMLLLLRDQLRGLRHDRLLDGLLVGTASIAVVATIAQPWLSSVTPASAAVSLDLSQSMLDLLLLMVAISAAVINGWRQARTWLIVAAGLILLTAADTLALYASAVASEAARETMRVLWPAGFIVLAVAAWQPTRLRPATDAGRPSGVAVPAAAVVAAVLVLLYGDAASVSAPAAGLATVALVIAVVRMCLMVRENATMLGLVRRQATTDALTGLDNRRSLTETIDQVIETATEHEPVLLVFYDLNAFKLYNDTFGHLAGDALLTRLGARLSAAVGEHGRAYRVGGDEFCVLLRCAADEEASVIEATVQALSEHGDDFEVTAAHGVVRVPAEARDSFQALHLADQRLYQLKEVRPGSAKHQLRDVLLAAVRERRPAGEDQQRDVATLARDVGSRLGMRDEQLDLIAAAAELHDVGKIAISDTILDKPGPLDPNEWERVRNHTVLGERILAAAPALRPVAALVRSSHERFDGFGYPDGLAGEEIPLGARIICVCATYEAMTADRAYRSGLDAEEALRRLARHAGTQFDPRVVDAFIDVITLGADQAGASSKFSASSAPVS